MHVSDINKNYFNNLYDKLSKENKQVFLRRDFDINLLKYTNYQPINEFLDSLASYSITTYILHIF